MTFTSDRRTGGRRTPASAPVVALVGACVAVSYTYVGYPVLIMLAARARSQLRPPSTGSAPKPSLTVLVPALNEEPFIAKKIDDIRRQGYPPELLEILVVADGSTDRTSEIAAGAGARVLNAGEARGKCTAVNRGVRAATGDVVVLTDANCAFSPGALAIVAELFADSTVAVVGGVKTVVGPGTHGAGEGIYWRFESKVMASEGAFGAAMGAPGELCAIRRSTYRPIPDGVLNDDYHVTCDALVRGLKVRYAPTAVAVESVSLEIHDEMERRVRIAAGTWQTTLAHLALCDPRRGVVAVAFVSHRVLRSIVVPVLLPVIFVSACSLGRTSRVARLLLWAQCACYLLALAGTRLDSRVTAVPFQLALVNVATLRGAARLVLRRQPVVWRRAQRGAWVDLDRC